MLYIYIYIYKISVCATNQVSNCLDRYIIQFIMTVLILLGLTNMVIIFNIQHVQNIHSHTI